MEMMMNELKQQKEIVWMNPDRIVCAEALKEAELTIEDIQDAEDRLHRFAPFIKRCFPETEIHQGIIESRLVQLVKFKERFRLEESEELWIKLDSELPIAGSVKARGGIYEVLKHTEDLAIENHLLTLQDDYSTLLDHKDFFHKYKVQVGSTGNLGLSIGIMSAVIGYQVIVHMSSDAKQWKKDLLRHYGVNVVEYASDYSEAVKQGRMLSDEDPDSYFVDDENSRNLFLGYAVAANRLKKQFDEKNVLIDQDHPLFVYLPCGVGGAPGGITFGLKTVFKDDVHCFFIEPTAACCMTLGLMSKLDNQISVQDIGLDGLTQADGLAVGRPSGFVGPFIRPFLSGCMTVSDEHLMEYLKELYEKENIFVEPSATAGFKGMENRNHPMMHNYYEKEDLKDRMQNAIHLVWATGGSLVPEKIRDEYLGK